MANLIVGDCARCGNPTSDTELMDFGPFLNQLICDDCWAAECEVVYARLHYLP